MKIFGRELSQKSKPLASSGDDDYVVEVQDTNSPFPNSTVNHLTNNSDMDFNRAPNRNHAEPQVDPFAIEMDVQTFQVNKSRLELDAATSPRKIKSSAGRSVRGLAKKSNDDDTTKCTAASSKGASFMSNNPMQKLSASMADSFKNKSAGKFSNCPSLSRRTMIIGAAIVIALIVILSVSLSLTTGGRNQSAASSTIAPTFNGNENGGFDASEYILDALGITSDDDIAAISDQETPQGQAFNALVISEQLIASNASSTSNRTSSFRVQQRFALAVFYFSTFSAASNINEWVESEGWDTLAADECQWYGCTCNLTKMDTGDPIITVLEIPLNNLVGSIPTEICALTSLATIELAGNFLSGTIPSCFATFSNLQLLRLMNNSLTGSLPAFASPSLEKLDLRINQLSGSLDAMFGATSSLANSKKPPALSILRLDDNSFTGTVPSLLTASNATATPKLTKFTLTGNPGLSGKMTVCSVVEMDANSNEFTSDVFPSLKLLQADCNNVTCACCSNCVA